MIYIIIFIFIIFLVEFRSLNHTNNIINYTQKPTNHLVELDENFEIISTVHNLTRRFLSYVEVSEKYSKDIHFNIIRTKEFKKYIDFSKVENKYYFLPRQKILRKITANIQKRGRYILYGASICIGDFLGFSEHYENFEHSEEIIVIPKLIDFCDIDDRLGGFIGDISVNRFIFEDPVLTVGFNDYTYQEPQKMISWTQSAKYGKLMVKNYDYTLELYVTVLLNIDYKNNDFINVIENCYSMTRSVCEYLENKKVKYKFITNSSFNGSIPIWSKSCDGWGSNYLEEILESLGRASYLNMETFEDLLYRAETVAEYGYAHIIITPDISQEQFLLIDYLKHKTCQEVCTIKIKQED